MQQCFEGSDDNMNCDKGIVREILVLIQAEVRATNGYRE